MRMLPWSRASVYSCIAVTVGGQYGPRRVQGRVYRVGNGRAIPVYPAARSRLLEESAQTSGAGPEGPAGAGVVGLGARTYGTVYAALRPPTPATLWLPGPASLSQAC